MSVVQGLGVGSSGQAVPGAPQVFGCGPVWLTGHCTTTPPLYVQPGKKLDVQYGMVGSAAVMVRLPSTSIVTGGAQTTAPAPGSWLQQASRVAMVWLSARGAVAMPLAALRNRTLPATGKLASNFP